jgi:hypothetical protein
MKYKHFINLLEQHQTKHIKMLAFPGCCTMDEIPDIFASLLSEIFQILEENLRLLCANNQVLAIIGMQKGPPMLESSVPVMANRVYSPDHPQQHFCLVLQYLLLTPEQIEQGVDSWYGSETLMIDFTTGKIMDAEYYLAALLNQTPKGVCYGQVAENKLAQVWQSFRLAQLQSFPVNWIAEPQHFYQAKNDFDHPELWPQY